MISLIIAAISALILFIPVNDLHNQYNAQLYEETRSQASEHLNYIRDNFQSQLDNSLYYADFFEMIVSQNPEISDDELREYSRFIIDRNALVDSVSLAKDGIISFYYPLEGNEDAMGYSLLDDPDRKYFLEEAIQKKEAVAQGPIEAIQGGTKIFNRKPVFIESFGSEVLWGFANITIDFDTLVENSLLQHSLSHYRYALKAESKWSEPMIWGDETVFDSDAVTAIIALPEKNWTIALIPTNGWNKDQSIHSFETTLFYLFILVVFKLVFFFVYQYLTKRELSRIDALTGLLNKQTFEQSVKRVLKYSTKKNGLLLIDFNDFKLINDTHGHLVGDKVLNITAQRLGHCLKNGDIIGRIGGDEIMILVKDIHSEDELEAISERIIDRIEKPILVGHKTALPSISIGHTYIKKWIPFEHIYDIVDIRMYQHKTLKKEENALGLDHAELEI